MPTRRIGDYIPPDEKGWAWERGSACRDPEHEPPSHRVFEPGVYEHECPSCHRTIQFVVVGPILGTGSDTPRWPAEVQSPGPTA